MMPDMKIYDKSRVITTMWYQWKNRQIGQSNRVSREIDPHKCNQPIFEKGAKAI